MREEFIRIDLPASGPCRERMAAVINAELRANILSDWRHNLVTLWALLAVPALVVLARGASGWLRIGTAGAWCVVGCGAGIAWLSERHWRNRALALAEGRIFPGV